MSIFLACARRCAVTVILIMFASAGILASDIQTFLSTPAWELQYSLTFTAASRGTLTHESPGGPDHGTLEYTTSLKRTFTASYLLDLRSDGPSISMLSGLTGGNDLSKMSMAEQQKFSMDLLSKMENTANWMSSGGMTGLADDASSDEQAAAMRATTEAQMGMATLSYQEDLKGTDMVDETGTHFNFTTKITHNGSGSVRGGGQITLELSGAASEYLLMMGYNWDDSSHASVKIVETTHTEMQGQFSDTTITSQTGLNGVGSRIIPDDATQLTGQALMLKGTIDASIDKITGEHTIPAHYESNRGNVAGALVVRFTLTPRP